jgi:hypothetical protein
MSARRILAAVIVAAVSAGSVLAACELFCATDCARAAAAARHASGCHGDAAAPNGERGCTGAHVVRLAVRDAAPAGSIPAAPPAFLSFQSPMRPAVQQEPMRVAPAAFASSASPPLILRV